MSRFPQKTKVCRCAAVCLLLCMLPLTATALPAPDAWVLGVGQSFKGWGDTETQPLTMEWGARWIVPIRTQDPARSRIGLQRHEFWLEPAWAFIATPTYDSNRIDNSWLRLSFVGAFAFPLNSQNSLLVTLGGGPTLLFTSIPGMGSRLNGHYQLGIGVERQWGRGTITLELRYHHVSNLDRAQPNLPLNGLQCMLGFGF